MQFYRDIVADVLATGTRKTSRTGTDTLSVFNVNYCLNMADGFPMLSGKRISWKNIVAENLWFLEGTEDVSFLQHHGCKFWDPWVDKATNKVPSPYGSYWRNWRCVGGGHLDQVSAALKQLKSKSDSRRAVVTTWQADMVTNSALPPCHVMYVLNVDGEHLNLHLTQRSCDIGLGLPYNVAGYSLLLHMFAQMLNLKPGKFAHSIVDAHIYVDHIAGLNEQLTRTIRPAPRLELSNAITDLFDLYKLFYQKNATGQYLTDTATMLSHFSLHGYDPHDAIQLPVAV